MSENVTILEQLLRLVFAMGVGMAVGLEREWREKAAGFRTLTLVSVGACAFMLLAYYAPGGEQARLAAGVITGIGFLGAGAILRERGEVLGLTTAATVWVAAALGMAAGIGAYAITTAGTLVVLVVLLLFPALDLSSFVNDMRTYQLTVAGREQDTADLAEAFREHGLRAHRQSVSRDPDDTTVIWRVYGRPAKHDEAAERLMEDERITHISIS